MDHATVSDSVSAADTGSGPITPALREHLRHEIHHYAHMLSEQGPMNITFVHNNTLLGLQKQHFRKAVAEAERVVGGRGYLDNETYRAHWRRARIADADIDAAFAATYPAEELKRVVAHIEQRDIDVGNLRGIHLRHGIEAIEPMRLRWDRLESPWHDRLQAGLSDAARASLLDGARADADAECARVGRDWTVSHWLHRITGVDLPAAVAASVRRSLDGDNAFAEAVEPNLRALGLAQDVWPGYLACIDRALALEGSALQQRPRARELWARTERAACQAIAQRHLGLDGDMVALHGWAQAAPEAYAAATLWQAALASFGLTDPTGRTDPKTLEERDPHQTTLELLELQSRHMQHFGGPPLPLEPALRAAIEQHVRAHVQALAATGEDSVGAREQARLCWLVLHDLGAAHLDRGGADALRTLLTLAPQAPAAQDIAAALDAADPRQRMTEYATRLLQGDIATLGAGRSHADLITQLTGDDPAEAVNRYLIRVCAAFLDDGLTAWRMPGRALGFFDAWRELAAHDRSFDFDGLPGWRDALGALPALPEDAVIHCLRQLGVPSAQWGEYLGRQLMRLKGWAGMAFWFELHPKHEKQAAQPIDTVQFLAVRLFCETQHVQRELQRRWRVGSVPSSLAAHFGAHLAEYFVRCELYAGALPDDLASQARALTEGDAGDAAEHAPQWAQLADRAWLYRQSDLSAAREPRNAYRDAWRLYLLAQHLGLAARTLSGLSAATRDALMAEIDAFVPYSHGYVWLQAYERHYRDEVLNAIALNHGRGRWLRRDTRPKSQVIFCIDEREENIHRHFEELDPGHETLGAAGFFGVALSFTGLDDHIRTPLCPAVATPLHRVYEVPRDEDLPHTAPKRQQRRGWLGVVQDTYWEAKRNLATSFFTIDLLGLLNAVPLLGRILAPIGYDRAASAGRGWLVPEVRTRVTVSRLEPSDYKRYQLVADVLPVGFSDVEQTDRCEGMLRNLGLTYGFARIVVWCAHGSASQNNPHENAHDCGACGGKSGAPNARSISAMLNRPPVRKLLAERGIQVPEDTWFVGALHNTASDLISYYDTEDIPAPLRPHFEAVRADLYEASQRAAQERCRRFGSSPKDATPEVSLRHVVGRSVDFSQVRPEWGHATNAFAVVGRRSLTQGVFFDRRGFIIGYDASQDPTGAILERIIMAVGPVGAGINLEYYFSTVDPTVYGCDTKVPHNVTGMLGVMVGAASDLRTGLPTQMTEVHEAMRLQLVVEAAPEALGGIYGRQAAVRELLDGAWVHLISVHPETGDINVFVPGVGFVRWNEPLQPIPEVPTSFDWYRGKYEGFLPPARITEPTKPWTRSRPLPDAGSALRQTVAQRAAG